jgi:hypothetical protein
MIADHPIRLATPDDAAQIAAMSRDYIEYGLPWGWTQARVAEAIGDPDINAVVALEQEAVLGFGIMGYPGQDAHLLLLAGAGQRAAAVAGAGGARGRRDAHPGRGPLAQPGSPQLLWRAWLS